MDETGWRLQGAPARACGAPSATRHAVLRIAADRHEDHARALLGDSTAIVTSDRWWAYGHLPLTPPPGLLVAPASATSPPTPTASAPRKSSASAACRICDELFWAWEIYQHTGDRAELKRRVPRAAARAQADPAPLTPPRHARYRHARRFARNLLKIWPALWTFATITRRPADQQPRRTRHCAAPSSTASSASAANPNGGERRIERLLSAHTTCRLQRRSLHAYLIDVFGAHARGDPVPLLA